MPAALFQQPAKIGALNPEQFLRNLLQFGLVLQRISSLLLAFLVVGTLVCGQCAPCPVLVKPAAPAGHDCCPPPPSQNDCHASGGCTDTTAITESYVKSDPVMAAALLPAPADEALPLTSPEERPAAVEHAPPPGSSHLFLLNSTLLI